jgi:hypothetical protein
MAQTEQRALSARRKVVEMFAERPASNGDAQQNEPAPARTGTATAWPKASNRRVLDPYREAMKRLLKKRRAA